MIKTIVFKSEDGTEIAVPVQNLSLQPLVNGNTAICYQLNGQPTILLQCNVSLATDEEVASRKAAAASAEKSKAKKPTPEAK